MVLHRKRKPDDILNDLPASDESPPAKRVATEADVQPTNKVAWMHSRIISVTTGDEADVQPVRKTTTLPEEDRMAMIEHKVALYEECRKNMTESNKKLHKTETMLRAAHKKLDHAQIQKASMTDINIELESALHNTGKSSEKAARKAKKVQDALETKLEVQNAEIAELRSKLARAEQKPGRLQLNCDELETASKVQEAKLAGLEQKKIDELETASKVQEAKLTELEKENTAMWTEGRALFQTSEAQKKQIQDGKDTLVAANKATQSAKASEALLKGKNTKLEQTTTDNAARISTLESEKAKLEQDKAALERQVGERKPKEPEQGPEEEKDVNRMELSEKDYRNSSSWFFGCDCRGFPCVDLSTTKEMLRSDTNASKIIPSMRNAMEQHEAALLPRDIWKHMVGVDVNHAVNVLPPRTLQGRHVTAISEVQPKNLEYLTNKVLVPYRDPKNPHAEPDASFGADYMRMCLLSKHPDVQIEAASKANIFGTRQGGADLAKFKAKIHERYGTAVDSSIGATRHSAQREQYKAHWDETVYRLSLYPVFRQAAMLFAANVDQENTFGLWAPTVLRGKPQAEAIYVCPPAAPIDAQDDGIDIRLPDSEELEDEADDGNEAPVNDPVAIDSVGNLENGRGRRAAGQNNQQRRRRNRHDDQVGAAQRVAQRLGQPIHPFAQQHYAGGHPVVNPFAQPQVAHPVNPFAQQHGARPASPFVQQLPAPPAGPWAQQHGGHGRAERRNNNAGHAQSNDHDGVLGGDLPQPRENSNFYANERQINAQRRQPQQSRQQQRQTVGHDNGLSAILAEIAGEPAGPPPAPREHAAPSTEQPEVPAWLLGAAQRGGRGGRGRRGGRGGRLGGGNRGGGGQDGQAAHGGRAAAPSPAYSVT